MYYIVYKYMMFDFFSKICKYVKNWIEVYKYEIRNFGIIKINKIFENLYILNIRYEYMYLLRNIKFIFIYIFFISIIVSYG